MARDDYSWLERLYGDLYQGAAHPLNALSQGFDLGAQAIGSGVGRIAGEPFPGLFPAYGDPRASLLGQDVTASLQSPIHGGGVSPGAATTTMLAAAPLAARAKIAAPLAEEAEAAKIAGGRVAWDPDQERWLLQGGKKAGQPITNSPLDLPKGQTYPNLFDPNDPALAMRPAGAGQFDLPRGQMKKGPAVSDRVSDLINNDDVKKQVIDYVKQGMQPSGLAWYNTSPVLDSAVRALGPDQGPLAYQKFMAFTGGTSPQMKVPPNIRTASYYYWRDANEKPPLEGRLQGGTDAPPPIYGHYVQGLHMQNVAKIAAADYDPLAAYDPTVNPKPPSFNQGLLGNYSPVTVDMHAFKLPAMLSRDPRFLATGVPKGAPGYPDFNPRQAVTSGEVSMDEAFRNPAWWEEAPHPQKEYPALEQYWKGIAKDLNLDPAQAQASGWIGGGDITGLGSKPQTFAQAFQDRIFNTAYRTGQSPQDAEKGFWTGAHPLLGVAGAGALASPALQQYWDGRQAPGATDQGGAPQPSQFY